MSPKETIFYKKKKAISLDFEAENVTSEVGVILAEKIEKKHSIIKYFSRLIPDKRNPLFITYSIENLLKQKVLLNIQGYKDGNDVTFLKNDPLIEEMIDVGLSSQPTVSRFENSVNKHVVFDLLNAWVDRYVDNFNPKRKHLVIDIDGTDAETHGNQQLTLFNGFYGYYMYNELLFHDGQTGEIILPALRPGNAHSNWWFVAILKRIIIKLRKRFPELVIFIRADSGFSTPKFYNLAKEYNLLYAIGIASNNVLKKHTNILKGLIGTFCLDDEIKYQYFTKTFKYQAKTWENPENCFAKVESTGKGMNIRYIITNIKNLSNEDIYKEYYVQRAERSENRIKELKSMCFSDRLSNTSFWANFFRLIVSSISYEFYRLIKEKIKIQKSEEFENAKKWNINSIRLFLMKAGAIVKKAKRHIRISISKAFVHKDLLLCLLE